MTDKGYDFPLYSLHRVDGDLPGAAPALHITLQGPEAPSPAAMDLRGAGGAASATPAWSLVAPGAWPRGGAPPPEALSVVAPGAGPRGGAAPPEALSVVAPGARLVVSDALLRQAAELSTGACEDLVARALVALRLRPEALGRFGFDEAWGRSLRHWRGRMVAQELAVRATAVAARGPGTGALVEEGRRLWSRLALSARLAGCAGVVRGAAPRQAAALCAALGEVEGRARAQAPALAARGFGAEELAALARLREALAAEVAARPGRRWARGDVAGPLLVLRGALLGDVKLLAPAARQVLPPRHRRLLSLRSALRRRRSSVGG